MMSLIFNKIVSAKEERSVVISEIQISGGAKKTGEDFIEMYNNSDSVMDISGWKLRKKTSSGGAYASIRVFGDGSIIPAGGYFLWSNSVLKELLKSDESSSATIAANNSIALLNNEDEIIDQVGWGAILGESFVEKAAFLTSPPDGKSLERIMKSDGLAQDTNDNSLDFVVQNTPTPTASGCAEDTLSEKCTIKLLVPKKNEEAKIEVKKEYPKNINITELFPNPFESQYEEYIELYNGSEEKIDLQNWTLHDASKSGKYTFKESLIIEAKKYLAIFKKDFKFALNNSGDESVILFDPNGAEVARADYNGSKKSISYNFDGTRWRWSKFLTPGVENIFNNEPIGTLEIDEDIFVNVYANFATSATDIDGDSVKITWDFGDGHKSYLAKTRHKFEETGKYEASVKFSDGSEDVTKKFTVEVQEFPHPKVVITAINANPFGVDTGIESLTIQNKEKRKINLNGWSIATGWKNKFVNHPIKEDVIIKGKKEAEIKNDVSSFTLSNTQAKIQLRYPDGEVAHEVKYKSPNKSIAEGEIYQKEKGKKWAWIAGQDTKNKIQDTNKNQPARIATQSVAGRDTIINNKTTEPEMKATEPEILDAKPETQNLEPEMQNIEPKSQSPEPLTQSPGSETQKLEDVEIELPKVKVENKLLSANNNLVKIELLKSQPHVLGAETVRQVDGHYFFTPEAPQKEHYVTVFFKNIISGMNLRLNIVINYFSK